MPQRSSLSPTSLNTGWAGRAANRAWMASIAPQLQQLSQQIPQSGAAIGQLLWPITSAETAAGVTPTDFAYPPGDIRRYGAVLDGTTDDASAWQSALKVSATYAVTAPGGTSIIGTTLTAVSGTRIFLPSDTELLAKSSLSGAILYLNTLDDVRIVGGKFNGNYAVSGTYGIYVYQSTNVTIQVAQTTACAEIGIELSGTTGTHCSNIAVLGCMSDNNTDSGISLLYVDDSRVEGCEIDHNGALGTIGGACTRVAFVGNNVHHNTDDGLAMGDSASFIVMSGNTSAYNGSEGINIDGCNHSTITGNTSYQNLIGIACQNRSPGNVNAGHNTITGNTVYECYLGILGADAQENVVISSNVTRKNGAAYSGTPSGTGNFGIYAGVNDILVNGNQCAENTDDGIYITGIIGGSFTGNVCRANGQYGIELAAGGGCARILISGNTLKDNGNGSSYKAGIYNRATSDIYIVDNCFLNEAGTQMVEIDSTSSTSVFDGNTSYATGYPSITSGRQTNNSWNYNSASPSSGTWAIGDIVWNSAAAAGGIPGWLCTTAGTPGTWKAMADLAP